MNQERRSECLSKALLRLNIGDMTAIGMYKYLTSEKPGREPFSEQDAKITVKKLIERDFINDKRFLKLYLEKLDEKLIGPRKIREELKKKDFTSRIIEKAMLREIDYHSRAGKLLRKRKSAMLEDTSRENVSKLVRFLVTNGYDYSTAYEVVKEEINNTDED